jgi:hypothetical protein
MSSGYSERGPVPKRSQARRRRNKTDEEGQSVEVEKVQLDLPPYQPPEPSPNWHPAAMAIWNSALESGQIVFWEPSDWAILALTCSQISQEYADDLIIEKVKQPMLAGEGGGEELVYGSRPMPAGKFSAILKALGALGMTEGDRRRMRIELERFGEPEAEADPAAVQQAQLALIQGGRRDATAG